MWLYVPLAPSQLQHGVEFPGVAAAYYSELMGTNTKKNASRIPPTAATIRFLWWFL